MDDIMSCQGRHHIIPAVACCHIAHDIMTSCCAPMVIVSSEQLWLVLPILQFDVCVGQNGRIQLIDVAHIGGLV